jgi:hypothetical protein
VCEKKKRNVYGDFSTFIERTFLRRKLGRTASTLSNYIYTYTSLIPNGNLECDSSERKYSVAALLGRLAYLGRAASVGAVLIGRAGWTSYFLEVLW